MKSLLLAAAFATVCALPAMAEDTAAPAKAELQAKREAMHAEGKGMREGFRKEHKEMNSEHKAKAEGARKACKEKMEAAKTPEAREGIMKGCRAQHDAMRKEFYDDNTKRIDERRAESDARHEKMKGEREEMKGKFKDMKAKAPEALPAAQ